MEIVLCVEFKAKGNTYFKGLQLLTVNQEQFHLKYNTSR